MKKYHLEILRYFGNNTQTTLQRSLVCDGIQVYREYYSFFKFIDKEKGILETIAYYPIHNTIIVDVEKL